MSRAPFACACAGVALACSLSSAAAHAADSRADACIAAHHEAQRQRRDNQPVEARASLLACSREECPALIRNDCTEWLVAVDAETPTLVVEPRTHGGEAIVGARAFVDGAPFAASLDGKALPIDPGEHVVRVEAPGHAAAEQHTIVVAGEHAQRLVVTLDDAAAPTLATSPAPAPPPGTAPSTSSASTGRGESKRVPVVPAVLGAVGVVGLGMFAGFGLSGRSVKSELDDSHCSPRCDPSRVDDMWRRFTIADVSLGVGLVAIAAGVIVYFATTR